MIIKDLWEMATTGVRVRLAQLKASLTILEEASALVTEKQSDGGWSPTHVDDERKGHADGDQLEMVRQARWFYRWDPNARAALETINHFVIGTGVKINSKSKDKRVKYCWREFWTNPRNRMALRQFEIVNRVFRDGECFIEFFSADTKGNETGKTTVRFIDPLMVKNPASLQAKWNVDNTINGIETNPEDNETVLRYWVQKPNNQNEFREIPADRMLHIKIFSDSDQRRGETLLQPVMRFLTHYKTWIENRIILNKMRSAIVLVKKLTGTASDVTRLAAQPPSSSTARTGETKQENIRGGTVLVANRGVEYEMMSPNINASDVAEDGRNIKLSLAAGTTLPEYIFGDASNANYASTAVAESPFIKSIEFWRFFFEYWFGQIHRKVIENGVKSGKLKAPSDEEFVRKIMGEGELKEADDQKAPEYPSTNGKKPDPTREDNPPKKKEDPTDPIVSGGELETPTEIFYGIDCQWNEVIHRNVKEQAEALSVARTNGWVSDPTAAALMGFNWEEEVRKQREAEEDAEVNGNPLLSKSMSDMEALNGEDEINSEIDDLMKNMTPEEKEEVLKTNDPATLMKLAMKAKQKNGKKPAMAGSTNGEN